MAVVPAPSRAGGADVAMPSGGCPRSSLLGDDGGASEAGNGGLDDSRRANQLSRAQPRP